MQVFGVLVSAVTGAALGTAASRAGLATTGNPLPDAEFALDVATESLLVATLAESSPPAATPSTNFARRDFEV